MENETEIIREKRNYIIKYIFEKRKELQNASSFHDKYFLQIKSWCVTIFMVSTGFCLTEKSSLGIVFYLLPLLPVILFWFLHAYKEFRIDNYLKHDDVDKIDQICINIYNYSEIEIDNIINNMVYLNFDWQDKGKFKIRRFFTKKLSGIGKKFFGNLENLLFFGGMTVFWITIVTIQEWNFIQDFIVNSIKQP